MESCVTLCWGTICPDGCHITKIIIIISLLVSRPATVLVIAFFADAKQKALLCTAIFMVWNVFFHPLAHFPGPLLARSSLVSTLSL
jgi:hypothetical protein